MKINKVAIVGGTHGDEFIGVHLLKRWKANPSEIRRDSFETQTFFANPRAFDHNVRYIDHDLNRSFLQRDLADFGLSGYEANRAKVLNAAIGPKGAPQFDFVMDLHTTTSNSGAMLILMDDNAFNLQMSAYLQQCIPATRVYFIPPQAGDTPYLNSISARSMDVEIGPIPQSVLRHDVFDLTNEVVRHTLDFLHHVNRGTLPAMPAEIEVFRFVRSVEFPTDADGLAGMIHRSVQDRDFQPLHPGAPLFALLDGIVVPFEGPDIMYPVFVNEAAYYDRVLGVSLATKETYAVPG